MSNLLVLALFFSAYALIHSLLASFPVKGWARRAFGDGADRWYRVAYNIFAVVTLLPLFPLLAVLPDQTLYVVPAPWRWLMIGGQAYAVAGLVRALRQTGISHFLGLSQLAAAQPAETGPLQVSGFYRCVRHPLYSFGLLFIWLTPAMTVNLLTVNVAMSIYLYIGSIHEEHRLRLEFGAAYEDYQRRVPRLIPWRRPCNPLSFAGPAESSPPE